jgi:nucleoside-diphosphate-sugar epimerase
MKLYEKAIIGSTGFVGSNLIKNIDFDFKFNSKNINQIVENNYKTIICSAPSATKWMINKYPEEDIDNINKIFNLLKNTYFEKIILLSSIDVYGYDINKRHDEYSLIDIVNNHNYGINRLYFENLLLNNFDDVKIVRLPGLFGDGLKKNILFDLKNKNLKYLNENINRNSSFQWYPINNLCKDLYKLNENKITNIVTDEIFNYEIEEMLGIKIFNEDSDIVNYKITSVFKDNMLEKNFILNEIKNYLTT